MIEPQRSIVIDKVVVSFNIIIGFVEAVEGMRAFSWGDVEVVVAPVVMRRGLSSTSVALRSSSRASSYLVAGASVWGGGGWRGLSRHLVTLAVTTIALSLNFGGNGWDEGGGEVGVCQFGGLDNGGVGEKRGGGGEVSESLNSVVKVALLGPF
jgi:hypothetical protein